MEEKANSSKDRAVAAALRYGVARGVFTNEAGLGASAMAHGAARTDPARQGLWGMFEVFVSTLLVCTVTPPAGPGRRPPAAGAGRTPPPGRRRWRRPAPGFPPPGWRGHRPGRSRGPAGGRPSLPRVSSLVAGDGGDAVPASGAHRGRAVSPPGSGNRPGLHHGHRLHCRGGGGPHPGRAGGGVLEQKKRWTVPPTAGRS